MKRHRAPFSLVPRSPDLLYGDVETGGGNIDLPVLELPGGNRPLVSLAGLELENTAPSGMAERIVRSAFRPLLEHHTIYQVTRRPGLPEGFTTRDMANECASWLTHSFDGPVDLLGISTGGEVAQFVAADHPHLVKKVVVSDSAYALGEEARALLPSMIERARAGDAAGAMLDVAKYLDMNAVQRLLLSVAGKKLIKEPADPNDFIVTLAADGSHDSREALPSIEAPALVIGGTKDFFYPEELIRRTAELIPNATLKLYEGAGHPVAKTRRKQWLQEVSSFLEARDPVSSASPSGTS
jgi:pimeloyl-ACP methyl ester carboxylesterase